MKFIKTIDLKQIVAGGTSVPGGGTPGVSDSVLEKIGILQDLFGLPGKGV